ncbi:hypothetical protein CHLNCDRAFT_58765 [Chlorella variabilis]|uniref:Uncharacterized protein n=1 Tax=Chlorella variabilis TaxID=554065 RepID=E1ZN27_CHLVA|nr:hypothetical protein CHLNCDRAFT_58765 [Chlorella variabilis]EFN52796.1 hypothetical protein CHLNCDRAFT_58765 [Chlorella variabilis]|eukprot:XP_005844898.1 hypothetical protein CHLNCDRAFT_58765 [Chlorella variabilis]
MSAPGDLWFAVEAVDVASVTKLGSELNLHGYRHADCNGATPFILAVSQIGDRHWRGTGKRWAKLEDRVAVLAALLDELTATGKGRLLSRLVSTRHLAACTRDERTVLHVVADTWHPFKPELEGLARRLISAAVEAGVGIDAKDADGCTPAHAAAIAGSGFLQLLLEQGAGLNTKDADGYTPLDLAARHGRTHLVEFLLDLEGSEKSEHLLRLAIQTASGSCRSVPAIDKSDGALQRRGKLLGALLQHPSIDARSLDAQGRTFLFYTCSWANSSKDLFPLLCHLLWLARKLGVAVNQQDNEGNTVLHELVRHAKPHASAQYVHKFVDGGADVSIRNFAGQLPSEVEEERSHRTEVAAALAAYERHCEDAAEGAAAAAAGAAPAAAAASPPSYKRQRVVISSSDDEEEERPLSQPRTEEREQQKQQSPSPLLRCKAAGVLGRGAAGRYRAALNHQLNPDQAQQDAAIFAELAAAGELAALGACVQHAAAAAGSSAAGATQAPSKQQVQQLRTVLRLCREAGGLDLRSAAYYSTAFCHSLAPEQREDDLANFADLHEEPGDAAACVLVAVASMRWQHREKR